MDKLLNVLWFAGVLTCITVVGFLALILVCYIGGELWEMSRSPAAKKAAQKGI